MNWKVFTTVCVSISAAFFPANGITCGPSEDPHDYFTSFFSNELGNGPTYRPFYYTSLLKFYDDVDWDSPADSTQFINKKIAEEWAAYGKTKSIKDAVQVIYDTKAADLETLAESSRTGKALPAMLAKNSLAQNLVGEKKTAAIQYLLFASKTESVSSVSAWEEKPRDSLGVNNYITEATGLYEKTTDPFLKTKYAYQRCKLAFYNNRPADCIRWYDEYFTDDNTAAVKERALSYKGGSLFRLGKNKEAAYVFSKTFLLAGGQKKSEYIGFLWATDYCNQALLPDYLSLCKNADEKATMLALFGLHGTDYRLDVLQKVYELAPSSPLLSILATREISKLEEQYFTPLLQKEKGGKALYINWNAEEENGQKQKQTGEAQALKTAQVFEKLSADKAVLHRGLYSAGAAYLRYMLKDYESAKILLAKGKETAVGEKTKDQLQLINLLVVAADEKIIGKDREASLLPSLKWLAQKAKGDKDYQVFCRNFFSEILAQKYEQQGDATRAALAYAMADLSFVKRGEDEYFYSYPPAIDFVREEMNTNDLLKLYETMTSPITETEKFFVQNSSIKRDDVIDVIGTSHLRDRNYAKAIEWLSKAGKPKPLIETEYNYQTGKERTVNVDPFLDYLNDWQRLSKAAPTPYNKLTLAKKLLELDGKMKAAAPGEDLSRLYYQYASALYNMSYYGNSWRAVAYYRSSSEWNEGNYKLPWEKEYYGVYTAKDFYQKAYEAATNKEFKAACLFMVAKCAQRQIPRPPYDYKDYKAYEKAAAVFQQKFKNNSLFSKFKTEFGSTKFYQYTYNRCSYLRDYVKASSVSAKGPAKPIRKQ